MKKYRKRMLPALLALLLLTFLLLPGCSREPSDVTDADTTRVTDSADGTTSQVPEDQLGSYQGEAVTLWVVTENYTMGSFKDVQMQNIIAQFQETYPDATVEIEKIPTDPAERPDVISRIRSDMAEGRGPDLFLLPTTIAHTGELLIPDVNLAMREWMFADLSRYYDADSELNTDGLNYQVMEAGVVDGARFALPLRFDFPVLCVIPELLYETVLGNEGRLNCITSLLDAAILSGEPRLAAMAELDLYSFLDYIPEIVNYDTMEVQVEAEEVEYLISLYAQARTLSGGTKNFDDSYEDYLCGIFWAEMGECVEITSLSGAVRNAAICRALDMEMEMYPLTGPDGQLTADVTYYGAVSSSCPYPDLAYEFLRLHLTEENQWERNPNRNSQVSGSVAEGYCVRTVDSVEPSFRSAWERASSQYGYVTRDQQGNTYQLSQDELEQRKQWLNEMVLTEADVPVLEAEIGIVRFPPGPMQNQLALGVHEELNNNPENPDMSQVAETFINDLSLHLRGQ